MISRALSLAVAEPIYRYDLSYIERWVGDDRRMTDIWDHCHAVATLQGIVNRDGPSLYLRAVRNPESGNIQLDDWWLDRLQEEGAWLQGRAVKPLPDLEALVTHYRKRINGLVVYDPKVAATSNVASTAAGVNDLIAVRYDPCPDSVYSRLRRRGLPVKAWLVNPDGTSKFTGRGTIPDSGEPSTGSAKNDAYRWAIRRFLDTRRVGTEALGYYLDQVWMTNPWQFNIWNHTLTNHDYFVAKRAFFCDLSPWEDEPATDDKEQRPGLDAETLRMILLKLARQNGNERMLHVGGFMPWGWKYTKDQGSRHGGVETEWKTAELFTSYNAYKDADAIGLAGMANASFYQHQPLPKYPPERARPEVVRRHVRPDGSVAPRHYVMLLVGDYDSAAWMYQMTPMYWQDKKRGSVDLGWGYNPNLALRFPAGFWYTRKHRTPRDTFVAGDSGAGYVNPSRFVAPRPSGLPDATDLWERHCRHWYERLGIGITGWVLDGLAPRMPPRMRDAYRRFSPLGVVTAHEKREPALYGDTPVLQMGATLPRQGVGNAAPFLLQRLAKEKPSFQAFRTILMAPSWYAELEEAVQKENPDAVFLEPYVFMELLKRHELQKQKRD